MQHRAASGDRRARAPFLPSAHRIRPGDRHALGPRDEALRLLARRLRITREPRLGPERAIRSQLHRRGLVYRVDCRPEQTIPRLGGHRLHQVGDRRLHRWLFLTQDDRESEPQTIWGSILDSLNVSHGGLRRYPRDYSPGTFFRKVPQPPAQAVLRRSRHPH